MSKIPFFKAEEVESRVFKIQYAFTAEHTTAYLVEGRDYALLIDTMFGYGDLRAFCGTLTDRPLKLASTHFHHDHVGGNGAFEACFLHPLDMPFLYPPPSRTAEQLLENANKTAFDEYKNELTLEDMTPQNVIKIYPVYGGDIFDLGDKQLEVIEVGGHTPGSIVILDRKARAVYSGDACNGNTLLFFEYALPVAEYLENLLRLKTFQREFDIMYGGHQIFDSGIIDEGIELCGRVIAGTDDKDVRPIFGGRMVTYGAKASPDAEGTADGKRFNIAYNPDKILKTPRVPQTL